MKIEGIEENKGMFKGVFVAYFILILHVLLLAGLGLLILFFRGVVNYMLWIFLIGGAIILFSAYRFYKKMKREGKNLRDMMNSPVFRGREVEVSLLGGLASLKVGRPEHDLLEYRPDEIRRLEDPESVRMRELNELVRLLENDLITREEYDQAKKGLFDSGEVF